MHLPLNITTAAAALSTAILPSVPSAASHSPASVSCEPPELCHWEPDKVSRGFGQNDPINPNFPPPDQASTIFGPALPDDRFYPIDEDALTGCIRAAVKTAGKKRWRELKVRRVWLKFLTKSRDQGLVGMDSNDDKNHVPTLVRKIRGQVGDALEPSETDPKECAAVVKKFTTTRVFDEIILAWAVIHGDIAALPPKPPQAKRAHLVYNETAIAISINSHLRNLLDKIPQIPEHFGRHKSHDKRVVPDNSTVSGDFTIPYNLTIPENSTINSIEEAERELALLAKSATLTNADLVKQFKNNESLISNFFDIPYIRTLLHEFVMSETLVSVLDPQEKEWLFPDE